MFDFLSNFITDIGSYLPDSFLSQYISQGTFDFLPFLNWIIPFYDFVDITTDWLLCVSLLFTCVIAQGVGNKISTLIKKG